MLGKSFLYNSYVNHSIVLLSLMTVWRKRKKNINTGAKSEKVPLTCLKIYNKK